MKEKDLQTRIDFLEEENDKLKDSLLDVTTQLNYSIERELAELVRNIYEGVNSELKNNEKFSKDYKFRL
jgi:hypothetical protein